MKFNIKQILKVFDNLLEMIIISEGSHERLLVNVVFVKINTSSSIISVKIKDI
jgi:hypothetical protein